MVFRLFWLALRNAPYGREEQACLEVRAAVPCFGVSASLSGSPFPPEYEALHKFLNVFALTQKEQLCSNASSAPGWKRSPPPYVDHFDITVEYSNNFVALPSLFPPQTPLGEPVSIHCDANDLYVEEDVQLHVHAMLPMDGEFFPYSRLRGGRVCFLHWIP